LFLFKLYFLFSEIFTSSGGDTSSEMPPGELVTSKGHILKFSANQ